MCGDDRRNVEFALRVEATVGGGHLLAQQPVGADQLTVGKARAHAGSVPACLNHDEMIANGIEAVAVGARFPGFDISLCAKLFIEHLVTQPLAGFDFLRRLCLPEQQLSTFHADLRDL